MERCWFSSAARKKGNFPTVFFHFAGEHDLCRPQESFSFVIVHMIEFNIVVLRLLAIWLAEESTLSTLMILLQGKIYNPEPLNNFFATQLSCTVSTLQLNKSTLRMDYFQ